MHTQLNAHHQHMGSAHVKLPLQQLLSNQCYAMYLALQAAPPAEVQGAHQQDSQEEDVLFSVDLEARKAGLRAQLALFAKVGFFCMPQ